MHSDSKTSSRELGGNLKFSQGWFFWIVAGLLLLQGSLPGYSAEHAKSSPKKGEKVVPLKGRNKDLPVPLARTAITFRPAEKSDEGEPVGEDRFVNVDLKGDPKEVAEPARIIANIAQRADRFAGVQVWLKSNEDDFLQKLNDNRQRLIDIVGGILRNKGLSQLETPGIRTILGAEFLSAFNKEFGSYVVKEVIVEGPFLQ